MISVGYGLRYRVIRQKRHNVGLPVWCLDANGPMLRSVGRCDIDWAHNGFPRVDVRRTCRGGITLALLSENLNGITSVDDLPGHTL